MHVGDGRAGRAAGAARGVAGGLQPQLPGRGEIENPRRQHAVVDDVAGFRLHAFAVEGLGAQPAFPERIVDDDDALGKDLLAHLAGQERGPARHRLAVDGAAEVTDQRGGDTRIVNDRQFGAFGLARVEPADGVLARLRADRGRIVEICEPDGRRVFVVAFHLRAFAGDDADADGKARALPRAVEAVTRGEVHRRFAEADLGAFGIGDAGHGARRILAGTGHVDHPFGARLGGVEFFEVGDLCRQLVRIGKPGVGVFGHGAGHGDGALEQFIQRLARQIRRRDDGLAFADQHAEPEVEAFRTFQILGLSEPARQARRRAFDQQGVRGVGAPGLGAGK